MDSYFSLDYMIKSFPVLLSFLHVTIIVTVVSELLALIIGCILAIVRIKHTKWLDKIAVTYVSFIRGTPFLVQLYLICFGLPQVLQACGVEDTRSIPGIFFVFLVIGLHEGGYMTEVIRSSVLAVEKTQMEAALSVGMTERQAYIRVVLPQALRIAIPAIGNNVIGALKSTALIFNVGVVDMMRKADLMGAFSYRHIELYLDVGIIYILLCFLIQISTNILEKKVGLKSA